MKMMDEGIFRQGEGVVVTADDNPQLGVEAYTTAQVFDDDTIGDIGVALELSETDGDDRRSEVSLLLDADEADALGDSLKASAAVLRSGEFRRETVRALRAERATA